MHCLPTCRAVWLRLCLPAWCTCHCHCCCCSCCCSCTNYLRWRACTRPLFLYFAYGANSFHCLPHCLSLCLLHCLLSLERETKFNARAFVLPTSARRLNVAFARQFPPNPLLLLDSVTGIWPNARERRHKLGLWVNTQFPFPEIVEKLKHTFRRRL